MKRRISFLPFLVLASLLTGSACSLLSLATPTPAPVAPSVDLIATAVQQTLAAQPQTQPQAPGFTPTADLPTGAAPTAAPTATAAPAQPAAAAARELTVAFVMMGDVYLWSPGLEQARLTEHGQARSVRLSPDGTWIAYTKSIGDDLHHEIWALRTDGSIDRPLVTMDDLQGPQAGQWHYPDQMAFLPGSHLLYYNTQILSDSPFAAPGNNLRTADLDSMEKAVLFAEGEGGGQFSFSPDGQNIVLVQYDRFIAASASGSNARQLFTFPFVYTYSEWQYLPDIVWMADSRAFRVIIPPQDPLTRLDDPNVIWEIPLDGSSARQLSSFLSVPAFSARPLLSPDGSRVAYQRGEIDDLQNTELHVASVDGQSDYLLQSGQLLLQSWSPGARHLAVHMNLRHQVQITSLDGNFLPWPVGIQPVEVAWVDGNRFLIRTSNEAPELYLGTMDGQFVRLASASSGEIQFDFAR